MSDTRTCFCGLSLVNRRPDVGYCSAKCKKDAERRRADRRAGEDRETLARMIYGEQVTDEIWAKFRDKRETAHAWAKADAILAAGYRRAGYRRELEPTPDNTPESGLSWRDGLDALDALLNDCAQYGEDYQNFVRVSAVRDIVKAVRRWEDDTDETIRQVLLEDAITEGYNPATGRYDPKDE